MTIPMKDKIISMLRKSSRDYVSDGIELYESDESSRVGLIVPELIFTYGDAETHAKKFPKIVHWLVPAVIGRFRGYRSLKRNPAHPETKAPDTLFGEVEEFAKSLGCNAVSCAKVPRSYVFKDKSVLYPSAIVLTMPMEKDRIGQAPEIAAGKEVWRTYDRLGRAANKLTRFLRKRGYGAQAGAAVGGDVNYVRLAQDAGLGWIGTHGLLISPEVGPSQRLAAVYTSIENLSFANENPHSWIDEFCARCGKCVRVCPGNAIYAEKPVLADGGPKYIDHTKCAVPFANTLGCSVCIKECEFFRRDYDQIRNAFLERRTRNG